MNRHSFIKTSLLGSAALLSGLGSSVCGATFSAKANKPFNMKFSPEFGIFKELVGKDLVDQIKWGYDQGFRAWESTWLASKSVQDQERISKTIQQLGMEFGQFVGTMHFKAATFAGKDKSLREQVLKEVRESIEIAKRMNTKYVHNVLGMADPNLPWDFQMANAIELLKQVVAIYEPHGITMVMETMNHKINHAGMFLHTIPQAYAMSKAVGSPSLKILFDFYHVQIQEGNIIPTLDYVWDEIGYMQIGDTPGRNEPTSGEVNRGFMGMEHAISKPGKAGEEAALVAYRKVDPK